MAFLDLKVDEDVKLQMSLMGWKKEISLEKYKTGKPQEVGKTKVKRADRSGVAPGKFLNILKSFRLTQCYVRIGFEDMQLNGILYPVAAWLSWYSKKDIQVSFTGSNVVILRIKNNLARMSWAWLSSKN